jgi:putative cell wall-binding protein
VRRNNHVLRRFALVVLIALVALASSASADFNDPSARGPEHPIVFPVIGKASYSDTFGAPRGTDRTHEGQDLMGTKLQPLVAAATGTISYITIPEASHGYSLRVTADDGWTYSYLHINNDTPGTDDGQAELSDVFAPGIEKGARVVAGQLVAFMGDSGNAESTAPHLHFEMRDASGVLVNAVASLDAAERLAAAYDPFAGLPDLPRMAGDDRVGTAIEASRAGWDTAEAAVLASGDRYAEALPASVLAAAAGGPLLLANGEGLPAEVGDELQRLRVSRVTVIGSVPRAADDALEALGITVRRITGSDRNAVAAAIAREIGAAGKVAVVVNGERFADGISASGLAAGRGWPILLASTSSVPRATTDALKALGVTRTYLVGGPLVLDDTVAQALPGAVRLAGDDRYGTSVAAAEESLSLGGRSLEHLYAATGTAYPDALAAGALAARTGGIVLLIDGLAQGGDVASVAWLASKSTGTTLAGVLGGYQAVGPIALRTIADALGL